MLEKYSKRSSLLWIPILVVASLFTMMCIKHLGDPGDTLWFRNFAKQIHYNYLWFAIFRYQHWSSRLLIESTTAFFSVHPILFCVTVFVSTTLILIIFMKRFRKGEKGLLYSFLIPVLFLLVFSERLFISAGVIAAISNYYFPMVALIFAYYLKDKKHLLAKGVGLCSLGYASMHEQYAVLSLFFLLFLIVSDLKERNKIPAINYAYLGLSFLGIISIFLSPGNQLRKAAEIQKFFPNFQKVNFLQKIVMCFLDTNNDLFAVSYPFVIVLLLLLIIVSALNKKYKSLVVASIPLLLILADAYNIFGFNLLDNMTFVINEMKHVRTVNLLNMRVLRYLLLYGSLLSCIGYAVVTAFREKQQAIQAIYLIGAGYAVRMAIILSPTMFASENRTLVPFVLTIFLVCLLLLKEISQIIAKKHLISL